MTTVARTIKFEDAVRLVRDLRIDYQWKVGDIVNKLEPKYGDETLRKFAEKIAVPYSTVRQYRTVSSAYPEDDGRPSFSVAKELVSHPDRAALAKAVTTTREARALAREHRIAREPRVSCGPTSCADKPSMNPVPMALERLKERWKTVVKSRRLRESAADLDLVASVVAQMHTDLIEIRRKHH